MQAEAGGFEEEVDSPWRSGSASQMSTASVTRIFWSGNAAVSMARVRKHLNHRAVLRRAA
jgi:hypothetical protein